MKKILALTLAAVMTAGMSTVAFADDIFPVFVNAAGSTTTNTIYVDKDEDGKFTAKEAATTFGVNGNVSIDEIKGGKKVAIPLFMSDGSLADDKEDIKGYKVKTEWSVGDLNDKATIELVKFDSGYSYAVTFTLPEGADTKDSDLAGEVSVYKSSSDLRDDTLTPHITLTFGATYGYSESLLEDVDDDMTDVEIVVFKDKLVDGNGLEGEYTMNFGDLMEFEVDVTGQGKLNLKWNTDFDPEFAAYYDYANIDFINFEKEPSFNKIGRVYIYADEDAFIYKKGAEGAEEINGLEWDEDYEAWTFKTRKLENYVISDVELDEKTVTEDKDDTTTDDGKVNPDTGR